MGRFAMNAMTPLEELRHSTSHVLATAVLRLFPEAKLDIGPPTDTGFYYDFDLDHKFDAEDLEKLEAEMKKVIKENQKFERIECSREEAEKMIRDFGQAEYKLGRLADIPEGEPISFYKNGDFLDLCAGTHVNYTKKIKAFKLLSVAGAYHRGDENNKQLQRIYGTAFPTKDELAGYLEQLEEAKKRDHRKLGKDMGLFEISDAVGQGLILWKPAGTILRQQLQDFISGELTRAGYQQVMTPHIGKLDLYRTSGHFPYYKESQFPAIAERDELDSACASGCSSAELAKMLETGEADGFMLRPMNCPMHIEIYKSNPHSYRDLPVRLAEFGTVYRWEKSGELNGMTRVRGFTQDDAHIFCRADQMKEESIAFIEQLRQVYSDFGFDEMRIKFADRPPVRAGEDEVWDRAETALREAVEASGHPFEINPGEGAFYGPKLEFVLRDAIGRDWQCGTLQCDFVLPERLGAVYVGEDGQKHHAVMLHRAILGSMERFIGVLIENYAGRFPLWLAPVQVAVATITSDADAYAGEVFAALEAAGLRAHIDLRNEKINLKVRELSLDKVPVILVVGKREAEERTVAMRRLGGKAQEVLALDDAVNKLHSEALSPLDRPE